MVKTIFVGRKSFKRDFTEYLVRMTADAKEGRSLMPFRKKKDEEETYPRIFLLSGGAGSGKSALTGQWAEMSRSIGLDIKKPMKVVTLDAEEILSKNMMMLRTLIEALYAAFVDEEMGSAGYFTEYSHIERRIEHVHEKVEQLCKREWLPDALGSPQSVQQSPRGGKEKSSSDHAHETNEETLKDTAFMHWLRGNGKLPEDELDLYDNSDYRLSKALVNGIIGLSADYPVVIAIDALDLMNNKEIEEWTRTVFLGKLFQRKNRVIVILSGRENVLRNFRNDFPETLLYSVVLDDYPLTRLDIAECTNAYQIKLSAEEVRLVEDRTGGNPFAVRNVFGLVKDKVPLSEILGDRPSFTGGANEAVVSEIRHFLRLCPNAVVKRKIIHCSLMRQLESNVLAKLWNVSYADVGALLADFASRYPFITAVESGQRGNSILREYLIEETASGKDGELMSVIKEFGETAAAIFLSQTAQLRTAIPSIDKRYGDERFAEALLAHVNALLWNDRKGLFEMLPGVFLECLHYNSELGIRVLQCIDEFRPLLTKKQALMADTLISGILSSHPMSMWLEMSLSPEENAMLKLLEENAVHCNDLQSALMHCRQGEALYRHGEYEPACEKFETCLPLVAESEGFKKTLVDDFCALGSKLFAAGNNAAVIRVFGFVTQHRPDNYEAWYTLARAQTALERTADSVFSYVKTLELKSDLYDAWHRLGLAYFALQSFPQAVESLNNGLGLNPGNAEAWFIAGRAYRIMGSFEEAAASLTKAIELTPENKDAWMERGLAQAALAWHEEAAGSFERTVQLDAKFHQAWHGLGQAYFQLGNFPKAIEAYNAALTHAPGAKDYLYSLALACHAAKDFDQAVRIWGKVIEIDPTNHTALYHLALSLHAQGQFSDAIQFYKQAASAMPADMAVVLNMGRAYHAQGLFNDAVDMYRKALQLNPDQPDAWDDLGQVFASMNLYGDAIQAYRELVRIAPDSNQGWYHLGHTYYTLRHYEDAQQCYAKAAELKPDDYLAWGSLGLTRYALGAFDKAVEAAARALVLKPDELWIQANCALSTVLSGNIEAAKAQYDKVIALCQTSEELAQSASMLENVIARSPQYLQAGDILAKLKEALKNI